MSKNIGRNEPCPCGSGKKFKKCCYGNSDLLKYVRNKKEKRHIVPSYNEIDYGAPKIDQNFYNDNQLHDLSAVRLLYSGLLMPEIEEFVAEKMNMISDRSYGETLKIKETDDIRLLLDIMSQNPDNLNHILIKDKLLKIKDISIPMILDELKKKKNTVFFELSVKILHDSNVDCSDDLIEIITNHQTDAYGVSLLCMLLGFYENERSEKILWNYYHFLKDNFNNETYCDGPLLGLIETRERRKERTLTNQLN